MLQRLKSESRWISRAVQPLKRHPKTIITSLLIASGLQQRVKTCIVRTSWH